MAAHVVLTLDTTAPVVVVEATTGTTAGEYLRISYSTDEPLDHASIVLADGRELALAVTPVELAVVLPPDTPDGWATLRWADEVGNADSAVVIRLTGAVVEPPPVVPPAPGGWPRPDKRPPIRRRLTARSTIIVTSRGRRTEATRTQQRSASYTIATSTQYRAHQSREAHFALTARSRRHAATHWATAPVATNSTTTIRRRDDPTIEAIILDLI